MSQVRREVYDNARDERVPVLVDTETGEVVEPAPIASDFTNNTSEEVLVGVPVKPGERVKAFRPRKMAKEDFTMVFHASVRDLVRSGKLDDAQKSLLFSMLVYADYSLYAKDDDKMYFDVKRIGDLMSWSRQKAGRVLNSLVKMQVMARTEIGPHQYYMFNPNLIYRGEMASMPRMKQLFDQAAADSKVTHLETA